MFEPTKIKVHVGDRVRMLETGAVCEVDVVNYVTGDVGIVYSTYNEVPYCYYGRKDAMVGDFVLLTNQEYADFVKQYKDKRAVVEEKNRKAQEDLYAKFSDFYSSLTGEQRVYLPSLCGEGVLEDLLQYEGVDPD